MRLLADLICGSGHWVAEVVDDKDQSAILSLRNDNTMILLQQTLFEDEMRATRRYDSLLDLWLVHLSNFICMNTCAVDNDLGLDWEFFAFWIIFIDTHATYDLSSIILYETFEFDVVGKCRTSLPWSIPINGSCKEGVQVHPRVVHLSL